MSKTNHRRGFKAIKDSDRYRGGPGHCDGQQSLLSDITVGGSVGHDVSNGHRGHAKAKRGLKKFIRSRLRFHDNATTKKEAERALDTTE